MRELEKELEDLKSDVKRAQLFVSTVLAGAAVLGRRMETLEEFIKVVSQMTRANQKELDRHLDALREALVPPAPAVPPPPPPKSAHQGMEVG